jgi:outer membrane biosynthesis protein TonB
MRQNTGPAGFPRQEDVTVSFSGGARAPFAPSAPAVPEGATVCLPGASLAPAPAAAVTGLVAKIDESPVFVDDSGGRKRLLRIVGVLIGLLSICFLAVVGVALAVPTVATSVGLGDVVPFVVPGAAAPPPPPAPPAPPPFKPKKPAVVAPKPAPKPEPKQEAPAPIVAPTTVPPTQAPVTEAPVTQAPVTEAPVTEAPVTEAPVTQAPAPAPEGQTGEGDQTGQTGAQGEAGQPAPPVVIANPPVADDGVVVGNTGALADQAAQN